MHVANADTAPASIPKVGVQNFGAFGETGREGRVDHTGPSRPEAKYKEGRPTGVRPREWRDLVSLKSNMFSQ